MDVKTEYGEVNISGIDPGFSLIDLDSKYTDIVLEMPQEISYDVEIMHSEATQILASESYTGLSVETIDE